MTRTTRTTPVERFRTARVFQHMADDVAKEFRAGSRGPHMRRLIHLVRVAQVEALGCAARYHASDDRERLYRRLLVIARARLAAAEARAYPAARKAA